MTARFLARIAAAFEPPSGPLNAVLRLFAPDGAFAGFPGPAACVDSTGNLLAANGKAEDMLAEAVGRPESKLGQAFRQALAEGAPAGASFVVPQTQATVSVTVMPAGCGAEQGTADAVLLLGHDMTLARNLRAALTESRQRYKDLVEISAHFAWETGADGRLVFVSPRGALGYKAEEMVGREPGGLLAIEPGDEAAALFTTDVPREDVTLWARRADGRQACLLVSCVPVFGEDGAWCGARGVARDVSEARERDTALARARAREQLLAYIVREIRDEITPQNMMNAAAETIAKGFGAVACRIHRVVPDAGFVPAAEYGTVPQAPEPPLSGLTPASESCRAAAADHFVLAVATRYSHMVNGAISLWRKRDARDFDSDDLSLLGDVANQIGIALKQFANHEELERLSRTDTLTGLLNRRIFIEEMSRRLADAERTGRGGALCYVDLDNFKSVNDCHGHRRGDHALIAVADIMRGHVRESDLVARLGGDEFALWLEKLDEPAASAKMRMLLEAVTGLLQFSGDAAHPLGFSIGIAVFEPGMGEQLDQLMARADEAMYTIKKAGKGGVELSVMAAPPAKAAMGAAR